MQRLLKHVSFRQLLVAAFLLIAALLAAASLRALFTLEQLTLQSRDSAADALDLAAAAQALADRSVDMERSSRQAVVLADPLLQQRFEATATDADALLQRLLAQGVPSTRIDAWRMHLQAIAALLSGAPDTMLERDRRVALQFRQIDALNSAIALQVQQTIAAHNRQLLDELETRRMQLAQQVGAAIRNRE